jgi:hypothetical protein
MTRKWIDVDYDSGWHTVHERFKAHLLEDIGNLMGLADEF